MSKEYPARAASPPGRPLLPPEAEDEILTALFTNMKISSGEIAAILKKHRKCDHSRSVQIWQYHIKQSTYIRFIPYPSPI